MDEQYVIHGTRNLYEPLARAPIVPVYSRFPLTPFPVCDRLTFFVFFSLFFLFNLL
jgi:hypothetical protein